MRIIARLDVKPPYVVKPVHYEGLRKIGKPKELALKYYRQGADEIIYIDIVSSLYQREILLDEIKEASEDIFVPFGVGGGVESIDDFSKLFHYGADKVIINTNAIKNTNIIDEASKIFGSQAVVVSIQAKKWDKNFECYTDCGRIPSGKDVIEWVNEIQDRGAGEIILSSIDCDGRQRGFELELIDKVINNSKVPIIVGSGAGNLEHILEVTKLKPDGIAIASMLHYDKTTITEIREYLIKNGVEL